MPPLAPAHTRGPCLNSHRRLTLTSWTATARTTATARHARSRAPTSPRLRRRRRRPTRRASAAARRPPAATRRRSSGGGSSWASAARTRGPAARSVQTWSWMSCCGGRRRWRARRPRRRWAPRSGSPSGGARSCTTCRGWAAWASRRAARWTSTASTCSCATCWARRRATSSAARACCASRCAWAGPRRAHDVAGCTPAGLHAGQVALQTGSSLCSASRGLAGCVSGPGRVAGQQGDGFRHQAARP